jgi:ribonuclease J
MRCCFHLPGLADQASDLLGVLVSRGHPDHYGLATRREPAVPLYCGERTAAILREAAFFSPLGPDFQPAGFSETRFRFASGHSAVTPYLADHSAFDAYSLLFGAGGRRLFYTGDLRAHGRKSVFDRLVADPPRRPPRHADGGHRALPTR